MERDPDARRQFADVKDRALTAYLKEKKVKELLGEVMKDVCAKRPDDVHRHILDYMAAHHPDSLK